MKIKEVKVDALWISIFLIITIIGMFSYFILDLKIKEKDKLNDLMFKNKSEIFLCEKFYKLHQNKLYSEINGKWAVSRKISRKNQDLFVAETKFYPSHIEGKKCRTEIIINNFEHLDNLRSVDINGKEIAVKNCEVTLKAKPNDIIKKFKCKKIVFF